MIATDPERTAGRKERLNLYYSEAVLREKSFLCPHSAACRSSHSGTFLEGQVHHVGNHFDATLSGRPMRVVIVGQEYGHGPALVGPEQRSEMVAHSAQIQGGFAKRNPHMKGTTTALRVLFGRPPGEDSAGEWIDRGPDKVHLFDAFALVNYLLCSATDGTRRGKATRTMLSNCATHFRRVMEILQPTVIICQGKGFFSHVSKALDVSKKEEEIFRFSLGGVDGVGACFNHPSTPSWNFGWSHLDQPYLADVVLPTLNRIRSELGLGMVGPPRSSRFNRGETTRRAVAQYEQQEELLLTGQEMYRMARISKLWDYLQGRFKIDLEVFTDILMECEKAGKERWTDVELLELVYTLRDAQDKLNYKPIIDNVLKGTA